jgi:hypothetical protein
MKQGIKYTQPKHERESKSAIEYRYARSRAFRKSSLVWLIFSMHIGLFAYFIAIQNEDSLTALVGTSIFLSLLTVPGVILHFNHWLKSRNAVLTVGEDSISFMQNGHQSTMTITHIKKITVHAGPWMDKLPWTNYDWIELTDAEGKRILLSCYLLDTREFWRDVVSKKLASKKIKRESNFFPWMK